MKLHYSRGRMARARAMFPRDMAREFPTSHWLSTWLAYKATCPRRFLKASSAAFMIDALPYMRARI